MWNISFFVPAIHIGAHVFNFERFIEAWEDDDGSLPRQLSLFEDTQSTTWLNPVRKHKAVGVKLVQKP